MSRRQSRRQRQQERYHRLAIQVGQAEAAANLAADLLDDAMHTGAPLSEVRAAYQAVGAAVQEPLPAAPALDPQRPAAISSQLSTLRTRRQWYLMGAPPGVLTPAATRPNSRAPLGPHVAGLEADLAERAWGVDLDRTLDRSR